MKKILSVLLLLFAVFTANAQMPGAPPSSEERLKRTKEILSKELQLNAAQINKTVEAFNNFFKKVDQLVKGTPPPPNASQINQIEKFEKDRDQQVISILNENQVKRYKEIVLKMRPPKPGQGNQQGPPPQK